MKYSRTKLIKMHTELASLNHCAVPFLSRAAAYLCWYFYSVNSGGNQKVLGIC